MNEPSPEGPDGPADEPEVTSGLPSVPEELGSILELMPEEKRQQALFLMTRVVSRTYRGPVPPADEMEKFKAVDSSFPERFVQMAELEQLHRHAMDKGDQKYNFDLKKWGQDKAFYALLILLAVILALVVMGETTVAGVLAGTTILGVVGMFITGRYFEYKSDKADLDD
ncbi:MAG TPA: hypothetical protein VL017_02035 [Devosia sp.]|nr:hypothetical protein [Sphingomonadaceae bacterium]HTO27349.1 hypothetical protein [Devosia sp.]